MTTAPATETAAEFTPAQIASWSAADAKRRDADNRSATIRGWAVALSSAVSGLVMTDKAPVTFVAVVLGALAILAYQDVFYIRLQRACTAVCDAIRAGERAALNTDPRGYIGKGTATLPRAIASKVVWPVHLATAVLPIAAAILSA